MAWVNGRRPSAQPVLPWQPAMDSREAEADLEAERRAKGTCFARSRSLVGDPLWRSWWQGVGALQDRPRDRRWHRTEEPHDNISWFVFLIIGQANISVPNFARAGTVALTSDNHGPLAPLDTLDTELT